MSNAESYTNELLWTCLVILAVLLILAILAIGYYIFRVAHFSLKRKRDSKSEIFKDKKKKVINVDEVTTFITGFATALARLSNDKVGAIIVLENRDNLEKYVQVGNKMDSPFFAEFVYSIFYNHESALHDGAMIIRNLRIVSLSSYLPVSKRLLPVKYGSRHRAGFGITERTDALAFVVSEANGNITYMCGPDNITLSNDSIQLANQLIGILFNDYHPLASSKTPMVVEKIKERLSK